MPPRHRSRSPHMTPAERGRRLREERAPGQTLTAAGFANEGRVVADADAAAFRGFVQQRGRPRA
eukprot:4685167-Alexandrium_andersonii.AAC.1